MKGHIRQRGKAWEIRYPLPAAPDGRRRVETRTVHGSKRDAQRALRDAMGTVDRGEFVEPSRLTVAEFVTQRIALWQVSPRTREHYEQLGKLIAKHLGDVPLQKLTSMHIEKWHAEAQVAPSTLRHAHGLLVRALDAAKKHKLVNTNKAREQPLPKAPTRKVKVPTEDLIGPMLEKLVGTEFHAPAVVTIYSGLRRSELLGVRRCDIDLDAATLTIAQTIEETRAGGVKAVPRAKTDDSLRTISLPARAVEALRESWRQTLERCLMLGLGRPRDDTLMFAGYAGQPQSPRAFSKRWLRTVGRLGLPKVTWHGLRHLHCSLLLRHGVDLGTISRRLGHSRVDTTARIYSHAITRDDRHAAEALEKAVL